MQSNGGENMYILVKSGISDEGRNCMDCEAAHLNYRD